MLKEFRVKNFRNFNDEFSIRLDLIRDYGFKDNLIKNGLVNKAIIYGENSSGKSNLGFAIMDITAHLFDGLKMDFQGQFLNHDSAEKVATFTYIFKFGEKIIRYMYRKDANRRLVFEEIKENDNLLFQYNFETKRYVNNIPEIQTLNFDIENDDRFSMVKYINNNSNLNSDSPIKLLINFTKNMLWFRSVRNFEYLSGSIRPENIDDFIIQNNLVDDLEKFFKNCGLDYKLTVVETLGRQLIGVEYLNNIAPLTAVASTGTMSLWLFFYWMNKIENISFLYLDEFDAFYHFKLARSILDYINSNTSFQSILTTHNTDLIANDIMRPDCYFMLQNNRIKSFADSTNKVIRQAHNLEKMMISDEFSQ